MAIDNITQPGENQNSSMMGKLKNLASVFRDGLHSMFTKTTEADKIAMGVHTGHSDPKEILEIKEKTLGNAATTSQQKLEAAEQKMETKLAA